MRITIQHINMNRLKLIALTVAAAFAVLNGSAQTRSKYDTGQPFGWAVCNSLDGTQTFNVNGGSVGGRTVTISSNGRPMGDDILQALDNYDIIIIDGSNGPVEIASTMIINGIKNKTITGINGATLTTTFKLTDNLKARLNALNIRQYSSSGNGGTLSNGQRVHEEQELHVRQFLIDHLGDPDEKCRESGIMALRGCDNIIIRNIRFEGTGSFDVGGADCLTASMTTHLWVDHCDFVDGTDGNLDINTRSDFITISWCTFSYTDRSFIHMNTNLIGANDNPSQGIDNLNVTYANCIWGYKCDQRMPMVRFGNIHVLNCYYNCPGNSAAVNPRRDSEVLLEGCYFEKGVKNIFHERDSRAYQMKDNIFRETFKPKNKGTVTMPYKYEVIPPKILPSVLTGTGGAGRIETAQPLP